MALRLKVPQFYKSFIVQACVAFEAALAKGTPTLRFVLKVRH
jgi:hypothetical protein